MLCLFIIVCLSVRPRLTHPGHPSVDGQNEYQHKLGTNGQTTRCASLISVVVQCKLVFLWGLRKHISAALLLEKDFSVFILCFLCFFLSVRVCFCVLASFLYCLLVFFVVCLSVCLYLFIYWRLLEVLRYVCVLAGVSHLLLLFPVVEVWVKCSGWWSWSLCWQTQVNINAFHHWSTTTTHDWWGYYCNNYYYNNNIKNNY